MLGSLLDYVRSGTSDDPSGDPSDVEDVDSDAGESGKADSGESADRESSKSADDDGRNFWGLIPRWKYSHYVQSGGRVREGQERAIEEVQAQAEAIETEADHPERPGERR